MSGSLPATIKGDKVWVKGSVCPKKSAAVGMDLHQDRVYCQSNGARCKMLQMLEGPNEIVCKAATSEERVAPKDNSLKEVILAAVKFKDWVSDKTFTNPKTGNKVHFRSLPVEEQQKIRSRFKKMKGTEKKTKERGAPEPKHSGKAFFPDEEFKKSVFVDQPVKTKEELYKNAKEAHKLQSKWLNEGQGLDAEIDANVVHLDKPGLTGEDMARLVRESLDTPGPVIVIGGLKGEKRAEQKAQADYQGDWSQMHDVVRSTVAVDSLDQLHDVIQKLNKSGMKVAKPPTDRINNPTVGGYRDLKLNVELPNGHIGELQLHLKPILKVKETQGHKLYEDIRDVESDMALEGRTEYTPEEKKIVDTANERSRKVYGAAWDQSTRRQAAVNKTKLFIFGDLPAFQREGSVPMSVNRAGRIRPVYDHHKWAHDAHEVDYKVWSRHFRSNKVPNQVKKMLQSKRVADVVLRHKKSKKG